MFTRLTTSRLILCVELLILTAAQVEPRTGNYNDDRCGIQHIDGRRRLQDVVRNTAVAHDEFPWVVALIYKHMCSGKELILCSGTLVTNQHVVTAAQCVVSTDTTQLKRVRLGAYNIEKKSNCYIEDGVEECFEFVDRNIDIRLVHESYEPSTALYDIALLRLEDIVPFTDYIRPICLSETWQATSNTYYISGWNAQTSITNNNRIKKKILALVDPGKCNFSGRPFNTTYHICTEDTGEYLHSLGDAGAPLMIFRKQRWYLEGIFSWTGIGDKTNVKVHIKVPIVSEWIRKRIQRLTCN